MAISSAITSFLATTTAPRGASGITSFQPLVSQIPQSTSYSNGTGAYQADVPYNVTLTVTAGSPLAIDLNAGTIKQDDGVTVASFAKIKRFAIQYNSGTGKLTFGGGSNALPDIAGALYGTSAIGSVFHVEDPVNGVSTLVPSTGDILNIVSSAGTITFTLMLLGTSV